MMTCDPVKSYYDAVDSIHFHARHYAPFTYLAYKSLLPTSDDDFIGLAYKISYYAMFRFCICMGVQFFSPLWSVVPLLPFACDYIWIGYHWHKQGVHPVKGEGRILHPIAALFCLTVSLLVFQWSDRAFQRFSDMSCG